MRARPDRCGAGVPSAPLVRDLSASISVGSRLIQPRPMAVRLAAVLALALALALDAGGAGADVGRYQAKITDANRVGLTVTNYGFFGNNFNSRAPSFEYPLGEGFEHMSRAGLWI